jgi:hypothetical protein
LTDRLGQALRGLIVEADDWATLRLLALVEELWQEEAGSLSPELTARVGWRQRAMRTYLVIREREPVRLAAFRRDLEDFASELERAGIAVRQLSYEYSPGVVARFALREGIPVVLGAPLALLGMALHMIPYRLTGLAAKLLDRTAEEEATDKIAAGLVLYPVAWAAEAATAYWLLGVKWAIVLLVALLPTGFFAVAWRARFDRVVQESRAFVRFLSDR